MSQLKIQHRKSDEVAIVDLDGRLTLGENSVALREAVRGLLAAGQQKIIINLANVGYVDSSGVGELVSAYAAARRVDASLKLLNLTQKMEGLLQITKLLTIFETFEDEAQAVNSFGS